MYGKIFRFFPLFSDTNASIVGSNTECWLIAFQTEIIDFTHKMTTEFLVKLNKLCKYNRFSLVFRLRKKVHLHVNSIAGMTDVQQKKINILMLERALFNTYIFFRSVICFTHEYQNFIHTKCVWLQMFTLNLILSL